MKVPAHPLMRDIIALVVAALACPISVFGGANLGCVGRASFEGDCASTMVGVSPLILIGAGIIAGVSSRGWTGLFVTLVGVATGMFVILAISNVVGRPVPPDLFTGVVATIWFSVPTMIGYGIGRVVNRLLATRAR